MLDVRLKGPVTNREQVRVGMSVGHDPKSDPYRPDMRKDEENITLEDRQEAKRRIE